MNSNTNEVALALLKKLGKGFNNNDANAVMDCVTDDFEWRLNAGGAPAGRVLKGKDDLRRYFADKSTAHREARYSEARIHRAGDKIFGTFRVTGIDAQGNLIYVASDGLSVRTLAELLKRAGAVRAMELDINYPWVSFNVFPHGADGHLDPAKA